MALLEKEEQRPSAVPEELSAAANKIFTYQFIAGVYEKLVKRLKPPVIEALTADPNVQMRVGEGFEVNDHGMVIPSDRAYPNYNAIAMHDRTQLKKTDPRYVRIEDLINCIRPDGFDLEKVKQVFGNIEGLVDLRKQRQFQFRANSAYKTELMKQYFPGMTEEEDGEEEKPKAKKGKKAKEKADEVVLPERV